MGNDGDVMITFKQYFTEHCKTKEYFAPFNTLQIKILRSLYDNILRKTIPEYADLEILNDDKLLMFYYQEMIIALRLLGDVLCKQIPNERVMKYSQNDVDRWAEKLYSMMESKNEQTS